MEISFQDAIAEETYNAFLAGLKSSFELQSWGISLLVSGYDEKQRRYINDLVQRFISFVPGCSYVYKACQPTHPNASIDYIMQTGQQDVRENVLLELIVQLISEPAFNQLRTNEQLGNVTKSSWIFFFLSGYIVHTGARRNRGVQGVELLIQGQHDPEFMEERIENFLMQFRVFLKLFRSFVISVAVGKSGWIFFFLSGYIVHTGARRNRGVQGVELLIQGQHDPEFMEERIENFLMQFRVFLKLF
ncbi:unnamed protein product [Gongylonema pulchrum]|uniref:Peptidase_M16_M domain-containing protein n=1 Tax=Gongylonema pulchrum TaxID=637853 RepID=A0A183E825_9BILA|nr:unnamed protein product [Gongylonema pulchrum]